ncbi:MAG: ABC transporter ATP-binding protein [Planctomycetaceae bacterium]|nr:ABC transporter ATP-binding protein [Planctomycetaceae bacterium]
MVNDLLVYVDQVSKSFGRIQALTDVSLDIGPGVTGLLGPNGSGKSTLIKILLGLLQSDSGETRVLGMDPRRQARAIRTQVGYMPEDDCYIENVEAVEMVRFGARLNGQPSLESLRRAHEILDFCGVHEERYRLIDTFSTGMRQKVKFAQAIVHDPKILIMDEPTSGLDPEERQIMLRRIRNLADRAGKAVIISTHILPDVESVCDQVLILSQGRLQLSGSLEELTTTAPELYLKVVGSAEELVETMMRQGLQVELADRGTIKVQHSGDVAAIWASASEAGVRIRSMVPARNTLEQVFIEAVSGDSHAHS